jgi:hypothetical protein
MPMCIKYSLAIAHSIQNIVMVKTYYIMGRREYPKSIDCPTNICQTTSPDPVWQSMCSFFYRPPP